MADALSEAHLPVGEFSLILNTNAAAQFPTLPYQQAMETAEANAVNRSVFYQGAISMEYYSLIKH